MPRVGDVCTWPRDAAVPAVPTVPRPWGIQLGIIPAAATGRESWAVPPSSVKALLSIGRIYVMRTVLTATYSPTPRKGL
jgi:hypothetical protein